MLTLESKGEDESVLVLSWQQEVEPSESHTESPEDETPNKASVETKGQERSVGQRSRSDPRGDPTEGKPPKKDRETTRKASRGRAAYPSHASGGPWRSHVCVWVWGLYRTLAAIRHHH
ncbi:hypothetical protein NDU88_001952 [Pleurodeles waltl]|uniref:Uncharacterized protein n=1 Tax=Pleurodeles waltl TaxID=8319 RepID=A0AAV7SBU9_PLEWA|nr:hypothetical protein NDU88_001952 [Pleurodeles waltl]